MKLRLFRARQLLKQTSMSIIEIALACGFVSTPHFSKCYREHIGIPPREERSDMRSQARGNTMTQLATAALSVLSNMNEHVPAPISMRALSEAKFEPSYGSVAVA